MHLFMRKIQQYFLQVVQSSRQSYLRLPSPANISNQIQRKKYIFRSLFPRNTVAIIKKSQRILCLALTSTISGHQFVEWRSSLNLEEYFTVILYSQTAVFRVRMKHTELTTYR